MRKDVIISALMLAHCQNFDRFSAALGPAIAIGACLCCVTRQMQILSSTGNMYAVGGCDESNFRLNSVEQYNPATDTWTFIAPMTTSRSSPCVLACRALYVIGGVSYVGMSLNTGECLDRSTNRWRSIAPMHDKRASASGAATNGKIYVIGKLTFRD